MYSCYVRDVFPGSVDFEGAAAYAYLGWYKSVFKNGFASKMEVQMQELDGHNLDLHHSGLGSKTYANHDGYVFLWYHLAIRLGLPLTPL